MIKLLFALTRYTQLSKLSLSQLRIQTKAKQIAEALLYGIKPRVGPHLLF